MNTQHVSDEELIRLYLKGDQSGFAQLLKRHQRKVFSYILMAVKDNALADDIFQETFFKVITTLKSGTYKEEGKFIQWSMRIAHNLIIDHFRREKKYPVIGQKEDFDIFETIQIFDINVEDQMVTDQIHDDLRRLVEMLPSEQKEVLIMRHYNDMSFKEIAEETNVSINTALGRMRYALLNLRRYIRDREEVLLP